MTDYSRVSTSIEEHCNGTVVENKETSDRVAPDDSSLKTQEGGRCNRCRCLFPDAPLSEYKKTLKELAVLTWPMMLYLITSQLFAVTTIIFTGHLGKEEIVSAALGQSIIHVFWRSLLIGFASGADTLFTQTFGSPNKKRVGIILQRFLVISMLMAIVCWGILLNTEGVLLLFGQDPRIAKLSGVYGIIFIAATPADIVVIFLVKYLESQSIVKPILIISVIMGVLNVLLHFITVSALQRGLLGAVGAQVITYYIGAFLISGYIYKRRIYKLTWPGWSWECLQEWHTVVKLSIGGIGISAIEWWSFEAGFFIAGLYGITEVGAHAVLFNIATFTWCFATGVGIGASILIGNNLGAKNTTKARITTCLALIVTAIIGLTSICFYLPMKDVLGYIFTKDTDVIQLAATIIPVIAASEIFDSMNAACFGILRGCGYQYVGAVICLIGQGTGLALGVSLMFTYGQGLKGLWLGMFAALVLENLLIIVFVFGFINWDKEVGKAQIRAAVLPDTRKVNYDGEIPLESMTNAVPEEEVQLSTNRDGDQGNPSRNKEFTICPNDHHGNGESNSHRVDEGEQSGFHCQECENTQGLDGDCEVETRPNCSLDGETQDETRPTEEASAEIDVLTLGRLSVTQLIVRRGLALVLCVVFFLASVYVAFYIVPAVRPTFQESLNTTTNYTTDYSDDSLGNDTLTVDLTEF